MARQENIFTNLGQAFYKEMSAIVQQILIANGVKSGSDLAKSVEFTTTNSRDSLYMLTNDYYQAVSSGRKPRTRKIPIQRLIQFVKDNGITGNVTSIAYRMQRSIYQNGIKGKNFIEK